MTDSSEAPWAQYQDGTRWEVTGEGALLQMQIPMGPTMSKVESMPLVEGTILTCLGALDTPLGKEVQFIVENIEDPTAGRVWPVDIAPDEVVFPGEDLLEKVS